MKDLFEELETERLILRKIVDDDAVTLYNNIFNDFDWYKFYYQVPFNTLDEYQQIVSKYKEWYLNGNHFRWGIALKESNEMIGAVQLHTKDDINKNCRIGYIISYKYDKKGYMKEAVSKVIDFVFNTLDYHRLEASIVEENINSINLAEKLGMQFESIKKDSYKLGDKYYNNKVYVLINDKH